MDRNNIYNTGNKGVLIACTLIISWAFFLGLFLSIKDPGVIISLVGILVITHLYTGLFITAHDSMHGSITSNKKANALLGKIASALYAFNNYNTLKKNHHLHHVKVATEEDPDYHEGFFFSWFFSFLKNYISAIQIILMAVAFNLLILIFPEKNVLLFWILPALLSTFQLFIFGTYLPHRKRFHGKNIHKAGSLPKNHFLAFITCYFFGYHYEHHQYPYIPWWKLPQVR